MESCILITGGTGFLGSHIAELLVNNARPVIILKRSFSDVSKLKDFINNPFLKLYDIDKVSCECVFEENTIDIVIHTAVSYGRGADELVSDLLDTNLMFPIKLIELGIKYNVKGFLNADSFFSKPVFNYSYLKSYINSKKNLFEWLSYFSNKIDIANLRIEHVYGERDASDKFVMSVFNKLINQSPVIDLSEGLQKRDFIYVKDAANAFISVADKMITGQNNGFKTFEVGTGRSFEVRYFVEQMKQITKSNSVLNFGAFPYRHDEIMDSSADIVELNKIGWKAKFSISEGITNIFKFYVEENNR